MPWEAALEISDERSARRYRYANLGALLLGLAVLGVCSLYSPPLFRIAAEVFYTIDAFVILAMAWNLRRLVADDYPLFLGIALAVVASLHLLHAFTYPGLGIVAVEDPNLSLQVWIAAQYLGSVSLLLAPLVLGRRLNAAALLALFALVAAAFLVTILWWQVFPPCWSSEGGLTAFKRFSEYVCSFLLVGAVALTWRRRALLDPGVLPLVLAALIAAVGSALAFAFYRRPDSLPTTLGHLLMVASIFVIYTAVARNGVARPVARRLDSLKRSQGEALAHARQVEAELHEAERRARALSDDSPVGIFSFDRDLAVTECNRRLVEILGSPREQLLGFDLHGLRDAAFLPALQAALAGRRGTYEGPYHATISERQLHVALRTSPLLAPDGRSAGGAGMIVDLTAAKEAEEYFKRLVYHDTLTELPNRALLAERLRQALADAARDPEHLAVCVLALDRFENVKGALGLGGGDRLLLAVVARLGAAVSGGYTLARTGVEEFTVLLSLLERDEGATTAAEQLRACFAEPFEIDGFAVGVTASLGLALYPEDGAEPEVLLRNAGHARQRATELGGDGVQFYDPSMGRRAEERLRLETELRTAMEEDQLVVYYQPQVELRDGAIVGVEALVRWRHPERGMVSPAEFLPLAEETGLIRQLDEWVMARACRDATGWRNSDGSPLRVAVNVAPARLHELRFLETVRSVLEESGLPPERLEIEITETAILADSEGAARLLAALREFGVGVALDDFGTGYSSLSHLHRLPIDAVKIDRTFVGRIERDDQAASIVKAVCDLGHSLGLRVVAEGIETEEQFRLIQDLASEEGQGYLFARPLPAEELSVLLAAGQRLTVLAPVLS